MSNAQADLSLEIKATREAMWAKVASRKHTPTKVFPFGQNAEEVMLYGTVAFEFKAGGGAEVDWAGRAQLEKSADGKYRLKFYQVYLVSDLFHLIDLTNIFLGYWSILKVVV